MDEKASCRKRWIDIFKHLFMHSHDMMNLYTITDREILIMNTAAASRLGYTPLELQETPVEKLYPGDELFKLGAALQRLKTEGQMEAEVRFYNKKRQIVHAKVKGAVVQEAPEILCLVHTSLLES